MKRIKLRKKRKFDKLSLLIFVIILVLLSICFTLGFINKRVSPSLLNFAEVETKKLANLIINKAITKQVSDGMDIDKLFSTVQDSAGEIQTIDFNPLIVNKILSNTTSAVQASLKAVEQGNIDLVDFPGNSSFASNKDKLKKGIIYEIPIGAITKNAFISNLGPRIPVKLNLIGEVVSNINTKINQYGINNAMIEVLVHVEVTEQVNLPLMSRQVSVKIDIPVALKIIQGKIPQYYFSSGIEKSSPILTLPVE